MVSTRNAMIWLTSRRTASSMVGNKSDSSFQPIDDFTRTDADVQMLFIINSVWYTGPIHDPLFESLTERIEYVPGPTTVYSSNRTLSALACADQYQFCAGGVCTATGAFYQARNETIQKLKLTKMQMATFEMIWRVLRLSRMTWFGDLLSTDFLLAKQRLWSLSSQLEENQWQIEVENIHNLTLASTQRMIVEHASPPQIEVRPTVKLSNFVTTPTTPEGKILCAAQKVRSSDHQSFRVVGFVIIIVVGVVIVLLHLLLPKLVARIQRGSVKGRYRNLAWDNQDPLQVLRMALEAQGVGPWRKEKDIPVTVEFGKEFGFNLERVGGEEHDREEIHLQEKI
jgi:hypothetical protein